MWFYDGSLSVSALVVIVGMSVLLVALGLYYGYRWYRWLRWRRFSDECAEDEEALQKAPLLGAHDAGSADSHNKFIAL